MTREEAIKEMIRAYDVLDFSCHMDNRRKEAFNMAKVALEQEPVLDKLRAEIAEYGSICAEYKMTGRSDKDIEQLVTDVLKQAKKQVLDVIDKYKTESEGEDGKTSICRS